MWQVRLRPLHRVRLQHFEQALRGGHRFLLLLLMLPRARTAVVEATAGRRG